MTLVLNWWNVSQRLKDCSHGAIVKAIYLLQLKGCVGFSVIVVIATYEHWHWYIETHTAHILQ